MSLLHIKQIPKDSLFNHLTPIFQVFLFSLKYTNNSWLILGLTFSGSWETEDFFLFQLLSKVMPIYWINYNINILQNWQ